MKIMLNDNGRKSSITQRKTQIHGLKGEKFTLLMKDRNLKQKMRRYVVYL